MSDFVEIGNSNITISHSGQISLATHMRERTTQPRDGRYNSPLNPLLSGSYALFSLAARLQLMPQAFDAANLQLNLIDQIQTFEQHCERHKVRPEQSVLSRYFICALFDDILEHGPSAELSPWQGYSLRDYYYPDDKADDRFFALLDHLQENPAINLFLLEMAYMSLVYGYYGPYRQEPQGYAKILAKQDELYHLIRWQHGDFRKNLFISLT